MNPSRRAKYLGLWALALMAATLAFVVHLSVRFEIVRLGYEVGKARRQQRALLEQRRLLTVEAGVLRQAQRIESLAMRDLGMQHPRHDQLLTLGRSQRLARRGGGVR